MTVRVLRSYAVGVETEVEFASERILASGVTEFVIQCPREFHVFAATTERVLQLLDLLNEGYVTTERHRLPPPPPPATLACASCARWHSCAR